MRLLVVTLCCLVAPPIVGADPTEEAAIKAIKRLCGKVDKNGKFVDPSKTQVTDAGLKELAALTKLTTLYLLDTRVTGAGLKELAAFKNLRILALFDCEIVTDDKLKQLATLNNLTHLDLNTAKISDTGLMELGAIPGLAHLRVFARTLSKAGKKAFQPRNPRCELSGPPWPYAIKR